MNMENKDLVFYKKSTKKDRVEFYLETLSLFGLCIAALLLYILLAYHFTKLIATVSIIVVSYYGIKRARKIFRSKSGKHK